MMNTRLSMLSSIVYPLAFPSLQYIAFYGITSVILFDALSSMRLVRALYPCWTLDTSGLLQDLCPTILDCSHDKKKQKFTTSPTGPTPPE